MKKNSFSWVLLCLFTMTFYAQEITPERMGFTAHTIQDEHLGDIHYYITSKNNNQKKPVLLYLDGSGPYPLFQKTSNGIGTSVLLDCRALAEDYHVVLLSKPGVPFYDEVIMDPSTGYPKYKAPKEYKQRLSLDWRVTAAKLVLQQIIKQSNVDTAKVAVLGISDGFQVGAKLASEEKNVTHLIIGVGSGLNQFYDFITHNRIDEHSGVISSEQAQKNIDSILAVAKTIYSSPKAIDKEWYGHTYLRWSSFSHDNPTENILALDIPIYIVAASMDRNSSILGTDYLYLESIRKGKTNIIYKVYPYDHSLNEYTKDKNGNIQNVKSHAIDIYNEALEWLKTQ